MQPPEAITPLQQLVAEGLEPLYSMEAACWLIPMQNASTLTRWLRDRAREFPTRFRGTARVLTSSEIKRIRELVVVDRQRSYKTAKQLSPLEAIIAKAKER